MSVFLSPVGGAGAQFFDNNGSPLSGGKLYTYAAGTTTPQATYTSSAGATFHSNPIILDAAGRVPGSSEIWLADNQIYKFVLKTSTDVLLATWDQITGVNSNFVNYTTETELQTATDGQTVFILTTMTYSPGTGSLTVYIDGVNQYEGTSYVETDSTTVTFTSGLHVGAEVKFTTAVQTTGNATDASVVTYTAPFTGAVAYTVEDKLAETVSVKDFGAVGDGVTDDTAAIKNALTALYAKGNGCLYFPEGTYQVTETIVLRGSAAYADPGLYIKGESKSSTIIRKTGNNVGDGDADAVFQLASQSNLTSAYNIQIENMYVDTADAVYGIYSKQNTTRIIIRNSYVRGVTAGISLHTVWQSNFEMIDLRGATGFQIRNSGTSNYLSGCYAFGTTVVGFDLRGNYSFADNLACDSATGIAYLVQFGTWTIAGAGCESSGITTVFRAANGTLNLQNCVVSPLDETNASLVVFNAGASGNLNVNGAFIQANSGGTPQTMAGALVSSSTSSRFQLSGVVRIIDDYPTEASSAIATSSSWAIGADTGTGQSVPFSVRSGGQLILGLDDSSALTQYLDQWHSTPYMRGMGFITNALEEPETRVDGVNVEFSRGGRRGDVWLVARPDVIRGLGWIQTNESSAAVRDGTYKKIPYVDFGVTADRPATRLVVGQSYFDTTLGKPIWWKGAVWVDATGATV